MSGLEGGSKVINGKGKEMRRGFLMSEMGVTGEKKRKEGSDTERGCWLIERREGKEEKRR